MNLHNHYSSGIANSKKADLDTLSSKITDTSYEVVQLQAVVDSLQSKVTEFSGFLTQAEQNKATSLTHLNLVKDAVNSMGQLADNTRVLKSQATSASDAVMGEKLADGTMLDQAKSLNSEFDSGKSLSAQLANLINNLIFSVEVIDKVNGMLNKSKQANPLIPDDLIRLMAKATTDANNAVAMTLIALNSCNAAGAILLEACNLTELESWQADNLYQILTTGDPAECNLQHLIDLGCNYAAADKNVSLLSLLKGAYKDACMDYENALDANNMVTVQLEYARAQLSNATTKLNSLKTGLAAAQAAAYAA